MQWDDARVFLAFAREGSFSGAAKRLGIRHSTVSRRIHAMENNMAVALVERSATGYVLTKSGQALYETASRMETELLSFEVESGGETDAAAGHLHVTAIANMASTVLMPIFARFCESFPNIDLRLDVTNDSVRLSERDADVALRQTNAPGETLIGTRLTTVASAVYGSERLIDDIRAGRAREKWVGVDCCDYHRAWTKQASPNENYTMMVDDTALTVAALKEGLGVGYLPCFLADPDPNLTRYQAPLPRHDLGLWLLYHRDLKNTRRVQVFREHMQREIKPLVGLFEGKSVGSEM